MSIEPRRMEPGIFLILRRLRRPLIVLISVYAVAVLGFTLLPGVDDQGQPWRMSFFHAFYFVSFLGTTIGLGEIPHPFSDAQRLWALASIYATVIAWLYGIGELLQTLQDPLFKRIVHENRVGATVRRLREPFVLLCGYDDAGTLVARELTEDGTRVVVVDSNQARVDEVEIDELRSVVPALHADALAPGALLRAGITHPDCIATLALTGDDHVNLTIALTAKLLAPERTAICVAHRHEHQASMARVGTDYIINPHDTFGERLADAMRAPSLHVIYEALTTQASNAMTEPLEIPQGHWVICGYGRFGRTVRRHLNALGLSTSAIDETLPDKDIENAHLGSANDPEILRQAGIGSAAGVVVATPEDTLSLSIAMLARELNPDVFLVMRQTQRRNTPLFRALNADINTLAGYIVAGEVLRIIRAPQLAYFLRLARQQNEEWAAALLARMRERIGKETVESWSICADDDGAPALAAALRAGWRVTVGDLLRAPDNRELRLHAVPLLLQHASGKELLPADDAELSPGDQLLLCGRQVARRRAHRTVRDHSVLAYVLADIDSRRRIPWQPGPRGSA
jgi:Trk K+ transport system NAD-binding subunit